MLTSRSLKQFEHRRCLVKASVSLEHLMGTVSQLKTHDSVLDAVMELAIFVHGYLVRNNFMITISCWRVCLCVCLWFRWGVYLAADRQCRGGGDRSGTEPGTGGQRDGTVDQEWNHCRQQTHGHRHTRTHSYPCSVKAQNDIL